MLKAYAVLAMIGTEVRMRVASEVDKARIQNAKEDVSEFIEYPYSHENGYPLNSSGQTLDINVEGLEKQGRKVDDLIKYYFDLLKDTLPKEEEPELNIEK